MTTEAKVGVKWFGGLLSAIDSQKYLVSTPNVPDEVRAEIQKAIDEVWVEGMDYLCGRNKPSLLNQGEAAIAISRDELEHLLNCLATQKFINEVNADGISDGEDAVMSVQQQMQQVIDKAFQDGVEKLKHLNNSGKNSCFIP